CMPPRPARSSPPTAYRCHWTRRRGRACAVPAAGADCSRAGGRSRGARRRIRDAERILHYNPAGHEYRRRPTRICTRSPAGRAGGGVSRVRRGAWTATILLVAALGARASGVSPYLPLNLSPEIERKIERVLVLAGEPVLTRPVAVDKVMRALPK